MFISPNIIPLDLDQEWRQ